MLPSADFTPVAGLAEAVSGFPASPRPSYGDRCTALTQALVYAAAYKCGSLLLELKKDADLPKRLRGREIPVILTVSVEISPGRRVTEKALSVFASPKDADEETGRRGDSVRTRALPVGAFLEYAEACGISVRFLAKGSRFTLIGSQIPYIRNSADCFAVEEAKRIQKEKAALRTAFLKERKRVKALESSGSGNRFFRPMDNVTAAVNADLTDGRRAELAVFFLRKNSDEGDGGILLVAGKTESELPSFLHGRFIPRTDRVRIGKREKDALVVWLSDEIPYLEMKEKGLFLPYRAYGADELLNLVRERKCAVRMISAAKELVIPFRVFSEGSGKF